MNYTHRMSTKLVAILNITPDSFSDGGLFLEPKAALARAHELFADGADVVDVGAEATNPWADPLTPNEEWRRLEMVLPVLLNEYPNRLSIDTYHAETAERALKIGDIWINDVMTFRDPAMIKVAVDYDATCIVSHAPLSAKTVKEVHTYKIDDMQTVVSELKQKRQEMINSGIKPEKIILDPGIGFGKTMRLNWELLEFKRYIDGPIMLGHSRKRFLSCDPKTGQPLKDQQLRFTPERNLEAAKTIIESGADYLRAHEIKMYADLLKTLV